MPIQSKVKALKILYHAPHHANEYVKEKEEKEKENKLIFLYLKNQALKIIYLKHHDNLYKTS